MWVDNSGATDTTTGPAAVVSGTLTRDSANDCFLLESESARYPVVWPAGTRGVADGPGVEVPDGGTIAVGDTVSGGGGYLQAGTAYIAEIEIPAACLPTNGEVAVFNSSTVIESP